jgi:RND family efflux transporter MFP subunit
MKRWLLVVLLLAVAGVIAWVAMRKPAPPEVYFTRALREPLVASLSTNGRAEPSEWTAVVSERAGVIEKLMVEAGAHIAAGAVIAVLDTREAESDLAAAQSRRAQAQAELAVADAGGRAADRAEIDAALSKLRLDRTVAVREAEKIRRLVDSNAAPRQELTDANDRVAQLDAQIVAQEGRRKALAASIDRAAAEARLAEADAAIALAKRRLAQATLRAPRAGEVYHLRVRAGAFVNAGDAVAEIGGRERLRVKVFVDEPELGRVSAGQPVTITWDARPGREWQGKVERMPGEIVALNTRQVGEVLTLVENDGLELPAGANLNVAIRTDRVENALTIPKEALRREGGDFGVFTLQGTRVEWRKLALGAASTAKTEVRSGLKEGDPVALPTERPLAAGVEVRPVFR